MKNDIRLSLAVMILLLSYNAMAAITTTTNQSSISTYCTGAPFSKLNICNVTCSTCASTDYNYCATCENNFTLSGTDCLLSNNTYTYIYYTYFVSFSISTSDLSFWKNAIVDRTMNQGDIVHICPTANSTSSYQFEMIGLFGKSDLPTYYYTFTDQISYITVQFNILLLVNNVELFLYIGQVPVYSYNFTSLSSLNSTYYATSSPLTVSYLSIQSLSASNVNSVIQKVRADFAVSVTSLSLQFKCNAASTSSFWALSDVSVLARQCDTCPKTQTMTQIHSLGIGILYTSAALIPMMIVFLAAMQIREKIRQRQHFKEVGGKNLPLKGIKKIIDAISGASKKNKKRISNDLCSKKEVSEEAVSHGDLSGVVIKKVMFKEPSKQE